MFGLGLVSLVGVNYVMRLGWIVWVRVRIGLVRDKGDGLILVWVVVCDMWAGVSQLGFGSSSGLNYYCMGWFDWMWVLLDLIEFGLSWIDEKEWVSSCLDRGIIFVVGLIVIYLGLMS